MMKAKELIEKLYRCDPDARVVFALSIDDEYEIDYVTETKRICDERELDHIVIELR